MKTDMHSIIDGINRLLTLKPAMTNSGGGLVCWEKARQQSLDALLLKLSYVPFCVITETETTTKSNIESLIEWFEEEAHSLVSVNVPTGGDDFDIQWRVISHYESEPHERVIAYGMSIEEALSNAKNDPIDVGLA